MQYLIYRVVFVSFDVLCFSAICYQIMIQIVCIIWISWKRNQCLNVTFCSDRCLHSVGKNKKWIRSSGYRHRPERACDVTAFFGIFLETDIKHSWDKTAEILTSSTEYTLHKNYRWHKIVLLWQKCTVFVAGHRKKKTAPGWH